MLKNVLDNILKLIFVDNREDIASLVIDSAFLFPGIPMWKETHMINVSFLFENISYYVCLTNSFFGYYIYIRILFNI